ncbi:integral membrane protein [Phyllosticta citrichinensis]|uniref:Integral membrane protein n=1 Tax=Phyllosticta citrichinensis TaxID=1130410 RepID=A0ABR1Y6M0_9PEZI
MEDRSQQILAVGVFFLCLCWISVSLRLYTRAVIVKSFGSDDWTMLASLLFITGYLVCQLGGVYYGTGRMDDDLSPENKRKALQYWFFCELFYAVGSMLLKIAVGIFLLRIAVKRVHILIIYFVNAAAGVFSMAYFLAFLLQCNPVQTFWTIAPNNEHCLAPTTVVAFTYTASGLSSCADWVYGILPAFIVWDLQMNKRTKIVVVGILSFAAIGSTATLVRIPYIWSMTSERDFLYNTTDVAIWSSIEPGVGMTAACIATLRPLLQRILHRTGLSSHSRTHSSHPFTPNWGSANQMGSKSHHSRPGYLRNPDDIHDLESLRPDNSTTTTTTTCHGGAPGDKSWLENVSEHGSEEHIIETTADNTALGLHISKRVHVTSVRESAPVHHENYEPNWPLKPDDSMV